MNTTQDFARWKHREYFTLVEAALLLHDLDPDFTYPKDAGDGYQKTLSMLWKIAETGELPVQFAANNAKFHREVLGVYDQPDGTIFLEFEDRHFSDPYYSRIQRDDLVQHVHQLGWSPKFLNDDLAEFERNSPKYTGETQAVLLECSDHILPWVKLMLSAYEEQWLKHDPSDPNSKRPSNADVARDIKKKKVGGVKVPGDVASVFARLIRPADVPMGRIPDTEDEKYG